MLAAQKCPTCGATLTLNVGGGRCLRCLLGLAIAPDAPVAVSSGGAPHFEQPGDKIGRYRLLQQIGEGGCGVVYMAEQLEPVLRRVALKVIKLGMDTNQVIARFEAERQAMALMDHPNIAKVLDAGATDSGRPFFVMELVRGVKITEFCDQKNLSTRERLDLFVQVCHAIQHAHQKGVIHRDIKPSNILVTLNEGGPQPKVIDFGIAKAIQQRFSDRTLFTAFEQFIGTPGYMSPEQAEMNASGVDTRSDIYSLGVLLYELLTGQTPFDAETMFGAGIDEIRRIIREQEPVRPSIRLRALMEGERAATANHRRIVAPKLINLVRGDLDWIVMKALEKERTRRYETANGLAADIRRHLGDEPVNARPPSGTYRLQKAVRRHMGAFAAGAAIAAVLLVGAVVSTSEAIRATRATTEQSRLRKQAEDAELRTRQQLYNALLEESRATVFSGELGHRVQALAALRRAAAITNSPELRQAALAALRLPDLRFEREVESPHEASPVGVALDPSFKQVAECLREGPVEIRSVADQTLLATLTPSKPGNADFVTWSPDGKYLAYTLALDLAIPRWWMEVWDAKTCRRILALPSATQRPVFLPHTSQVVITTGDGITFWDLAGERAASFFPETNRQTATNIEWLPNLLAFNAGGEQFAESSFDGFQSIVSVHRSSDGARLFSEKVQAPVSAIAWQPRGRWLAVTDFGGSVALLDPANGETLTIGHHEAEAATATFSPDGIYLFTGGWERVLICWDMLSLQKSFTIPLNSFNIQFRQDGAECALAGKSSWQLHAFDRPAAHRQLAEQLGGMVRHAAISPDGRWLAIAGLKRLGLWDLNSPRPAAFSAQGADNRLFFSTESELFGCSQEDCHSWRILVGGRADCPPKLQELQISKPNGFASFCQTPAGVLLTSSQGSRLIDQAPGQTQWTPTVEGVSTSSPDGRWLAIFTPYSTIAHIYRFPELSLVANLTNRSSIWRVQFSTRGSELAVAMSGEIALWSTTTWQRTRLLTNAMNLFYTPQAEGYWLTSNSRTAGLYSAASLEPLLPLPQGTLPLALSPDGRYLAVTSGAQSLELWDLQEVRRQLQALGLSWRDVP